MFIVGPLLGTLDLLDGFELKDCTQVLLQKIELNLSRLRKYS